MLVTETNQQSETWKEKLSGVSGSRRCPIPPARLVTVTQVALKGISRITMKQQLRPEIKNRLLACFPALCVRFAFAFKRNYEAIVHYCHSAVRRASFGFQTVVSAVPTVGIHSTNNYRNCNHDPSAINTARPHVANFGPIKGWL